jgi:UDP-N-acetylmuramoyl-L-alanyl-D-glutamate--2,6-diaminopimelate ligase
MTASPVPGALRGDPPPLGSPAHGPSGRSLPRARSTVTVALSTLTAGLRRAERHGPDVDVVDATHDSRQVEPGWLFCAVVGTTTDGHDHAAQAVEQGASALVVERWLDLDIPQVKVPSVRAVLGHVAAAVHDHPSRDLSVVGITGTNGKTTVAYLVEAAAAAHGVGTGVIGTVETRIHGIAQPGVRTTPEGTDLQRLLRRMHDRGVDTVAMEVSSHGLDLRRVDGTRFACIGFTNFSQDHLDWHGSMEAYFAAKARLATPEFTDQAVVCTNDDGGRRFADQAAANGLAVVTVGDAEVDPDADHVIEERALDLDGGRARVRGPDGEREVRTRLVADFNLTNAVVAEVLARRAGIDAEAARIGIAACDGVPGRLERVDTPDDVTVLVDYAHTPDAIVHLLRSLRSLLPPGQRIHLVLGCGGDRDRGKRPLMGAAAMAADVAVLTSDNPRSEDPEAILQAMVEGAREASGSEVRARLEVEVDRRTAIAAALAGASDGDVVLVAGKGHETGQEIGDRVLPFDDRVVVREELARQAAGRPTVPPVGEPGGPR